MSFTGFGKKVFASLLTMMMLIFSFGSGVALAADDVSTDGSDSETASGITLTFTIENGTWGEIDEDGNIYWGVVDSLANDDEDGENLTKLSLNVATGDSIVVETVSETSSLDYWIVTVIHDEATGDSLILIPVPDEDHENADYAAWDPELEDIEYVEEDADYTYAFKNEYAVTYDLVLKDVEGDFDDENCLEGDEFTISKEEPTKDGYEFTGWTTSFDDGIYDPGDTFTMPSEAVTLTANWNSETEYTITFDVDGGSPEFEPGTCSEGGTFVISEDEPTKTGYWFDGWLNSSDKKIYQAGESFVVTGNVTLTAQWSEKDLYTVTYDAGRGDSAPAAETCYEGDTFTISDQTAHRSGSYTFAGWEASFDGNIYQAGDTFTMPSEDVTLAAKWEDSSSGGSGGGGGGGSSSTDYTIVINNPSHGSISLSRTSASEDTVVTITVSPDDGYELDTLTVTDRGGNELSLTDLGNNKYSFVMPNSQVTVTAYFTTAGSSGSSSGSGSDEDEDNYYDYEEGPLTIESFVDVSTSDYFYAAVQWAVENGITVGTTSTTFSPNASCTRAQMVTFLWRASGSPVLEGYNNPFEDVSESDYYYDAVVWAVAQNIAAGTSETTFSPNATVTRAQTVTFLWRAAGSPSVTETEHFADIEEGSYYHDAVLWAVEQGITVGTTDTTFSPDADCTRAQIVSFLYRAQ